MIFLKKLQLQGFAWMNKKEGSEWNNWIAQCLISFLTESTSKI
jgi:hypothetical protein